MLSEDASKLVLIGDAGEWVFDGDALTALWKSGVETLTVRVGETEWTVSTEGFLHGEDYDALRSRGVTPNVFTYRLMLQEGEWEMILEAGGEQWKVDGEGLIADATLGNAVEDTR